MAVIEKRGPLQYRARVRRGGIDESETFTTKADAAAWAAEAEVEIRRGTWRDMRPAQQPFAEIARRYLDEVTPSKKSASREAHRIHRLAQAREFRRPVGSIQAAHVAEYRDRRLKDPVRGVRKAPGAGGLPRCVGPQTVLHELNTLSAILEHAKKEWGIPIVGNPVRDIRMPRRGKSRDRRLRPRELEYLERAAAATHGMAEAITLAVETSMRLGELLALHWPDVDLGSRVARLRESKNGESRSVALSSRAVEALQRLRPLKLADGRSGRGRSRDIDARDVSAGAAQVAALVRARRSGKVLHWAAADSFNKTWLRTVARAKQQYAADCAESGAAPDPAFLSDLRWHDLRHEAVSRLFERGLSAFEVASMSGHKSMQMLKRYTHVEAARVAAKLG